MDNNMKSTGQQAQNLTPNTTQNTRAESGLPLTVTKMDNKMESTRQQAQNVTPKSTQNVTPKSTTQNAKTPKSFPEYQDPQIYYPEYQGRILAPISMANHPPGNISRDRPSPPYLPFVIPEAQKGDSDRPPGDWARYIWQAAFKVARRGEFLKGQLPALLKSAPVRELMERVRYFAGNRHQDEILSNHRVNVESAAIFCQGAVMTDANQCESCLQGWGPWAKCVQLEESEARKGYLNACTNCVWNGQHERCSFWQRGQAPLTPGDQSPNGEVIGLCFGGHVDGTLSYFTHVHELFDNILAKTGVTEIRIRV
ncbi:hypothetical protein N7466_006660 [Penicillium verhagenii]|uniref:uncharacterized protein n=1 Tax=Penicillium verhagenii TaxID=1562060 RepID=UPI002545065F|nr:uncharacterized protein N7466_006660 [Penicillium verhagenii]KAJ5931167.1 hypothetical protein N7466_006660 [Penicillium verhagenii]